MTKHLLLLFLMLAFTSHAQKPLTSAMLEEAAFRFSLSESNEMDASTKAQWLDWIDENQFVGLAEVHNSAQLSFFTKALLQVLAAKDFRHFALEMGPTSARILQETSNDEQQVLENIRMLNRRYGKNAQSKTPMIFANNVEDVVFLEEASKLNFTFWGLDQEFAYAYEMLIDYLYERVEIKDQAFEDAYQQAKSTIRKVIFKKKYKGHYVDCWYPESDAITSYFQFFNDSMSLQVIEDIKVSWDIYCKNYHGGSNQLRAHYMKQNFDHYLKTHGTDSKVFVKLGGVHLTHGISPFGVNDIGKHLSEKRTENQSGLLTIRHLISYRNGKSNIGKSGWETVNMFLELGRKDQWTAVDLRPFREMLKRGEIMADKKFTYELNSYDILLLSPDDQYPKVNY